MIDNIKYDLFISHASEDKELFVKELAVELKERGVLVWYDEFALKAGDSIRESIEKGILSSKAGLVVLSKNFFKKEWTKKELNALNSLEIGNKNKIIPI
ncbi:MAG: toll/interleukin-1 receptor domain-containing protein [Marinicellaceae bacterium]